MSLSRAVAPNLIAAGTFFLFVALSGAAGEEEVSSGPWVPEVAALSLDEVTTLALENSLDIQIARFDAHVKRNDLPAALSIFDTYFTAQAGYRENRFKKASALLGSRSIDTSYGIGLSKLLPTGTTVSLDLDHSRASTDVSSVTVNPAHQAVATLTLNQSLGKNFFGLIDRTNIKITKLDIENAEWTSLDRIEEALADVQKAYWKLAYLGEEVAVMRDMYAKAKDLLEVYDRKRVFGLVEDPEHYGAQANEAKRQNSLLASIDAVHAARNHLLLLLNQDGRQVRITPGDPITLAGEDIDFNEALTRAIENRRDYKKALNAVQMKKLDLVVKKNSMWPEIDLEASFARNGLNGAYEKAWEGISKENNPQYYVGVTLKVPLENRKARAELSTAKIEQAKALLELKVAERKIFTEINDLVMRVKVRIGQVLTRRRVAELETKKLEAEEKRFRLGRSDSDVIIRYQEDVLSARSSHMQALYDYWVSLIDLRVAQGVLLDMYWKDTL